MNVMKRSGQTMLKCRPYMPSIFLQREVGAYDAPGRTTTEIVNHKDVQVNMINTYSQAGFRLTNNSFLRGPSIILPDKIFHWNVAGDEDINARSLEFFFHLHPPLDILIIGLSEPASKQKVDVEVLTACRKHRLQVEILPTTKAVNVYNFLAEIRQVAGAFIPPFEYAYDKDDVLQHKNRLGILYEGLDLDAPDVSPEGFFKEPKKK